MFNKLLERVGLSAKPPTLPFDETAAPATSPIIDVTDSTFTEIILGAKQLVIVDFWADWCQPCQIMSAYVSFLVNDFGEQIVVAAMDVDENPVTPPEYDIMGLPTLLFFYEGDLIDRIVGAGPYETIRDRVAGWLKEAEV